jgi:RNA polymerase sigma-70 factor, ECF subfamily
MEESQETGPTDPVVTIPAPRAELDPMTVSRPGGAGRPRSDAVAEAATMNRLVAAAVGGDARATRELLGMIHQLAMRYCLARLGRRDAVFGSAEDIAQEVCLAAVAGLRTYTVTGLSYRAFVYGIAAHKMADAFRAIGRNRTDAVPELPETADLRDGLEHRVLADERMQRLYRLLDELTPMQREVVTLRIIADLSVAEVARIVGSTPNAVRVTQHRALLKLRSHLTPSLGAG